MMSTLISLHSKTKDSALQRAGPLGVEYMNGCLHTMCMGCGEKKKHIPYASAFKTFFLWRRQVME